MSIIFLLEMIREKIVNTERIDINYILQYFLTRVYTPRYVKRKT